MKIIVTVATAVIFLTGCSKEIIRGSGRTLTETRSVASFNRVQLEGSTVVHIEKGIQQKVEVTGYENLLPVYETNVQNETLVLKFKSDYYNVRNSNITVSIIVPTLSKITINGSGECTVKNFTGGDLTAKINGSGEVYTENSMYDNVTFGVNGSGYIRASQVQAREADVEINGSGKIDIACSQKLKATIHGSGEVNYWGNPAVSVDISGSGSVRKK